MTNQWGWLLTVITILSLSKPLIAPASEGTTEYQPIAYTMAPEGLARDGIWKSIPVVADLNDDGHLDVVAHPRLGKGARVWLGDGQGMWREASKGLAMQISCGGGVAVGDIDRDGKLDLAVADHCQGISVYLGDAKGHWKAVTEDLRPAAVRHASDENEAGMFAGAETLDLGDIDEDGDLDIVAAASDRGGFTVYLGDATGKHWQEVQVKDGLPSRQDTEPRDLDQGGWANVIQLTDVNGDDHLDVIASYHRGPRVWLGNGEARWRAASEGLPSPSIGGLFRGIAAADVNEDGRADLVAAHRINGIEVYLQQEAGSWQGPIDPLPPLMGGAMSLASADLDHDGHLDLVVGGRQAPQGTGYGLFVLRGKGQGGWQPLEGTGLPTTGLPFTWGITANDVNEDGVPDLVVATGGIVSGSKHHPRGEDPLPQLQVWYGVRDRKESQQHSQAGAGPEGG